MKLTALILGSAMTFTATVGWTDHRDSGYYAVHRDGYHHRHKRHVGHHYGRSDRYQWARVIDVEPIYELGRHRSSDSCTYYDDGRRQPTSYTPVLLGPVIGGALGHQIGDRHGDADAAALAGGLLGAAVGGDIARQSYLRRNLVVNGPCEASHYQRRSQRRLIGYSVSYRYAGRLHRTRMDRRPGEWVKLDVHVATKHASYRSGR